MARTRWTSRGTWFDTLGGWRRARTEEHRRSSRVCDAECCSKQAGPKRPPPAAAREGEQLPGSRPGATTPPTLRPTETSRGPGGARIGSTIAATAPDKEGGCGAPHGAGGERRRRQTPPNTATVILYQLAVHADRVLAINPSEGAPAVAMSFQHSSRLRWRGELANGQAAVR